MKDLKGFLYPIFWFLICLFLFNMIYGQAKNKAIHELNSRQTIHAKQAAKGIESFFSRWLVLLTNIVDQEEIIVFNEKGKALMEFTLNAHQNEIRAITRVDQSGKIVHTVPFVPKTVGVDISYQKHIQEIMQIKKPVVSDVFTAVQGYETIALHVPVFNHKKFKGTLAILLDFKTISKRYLEDIRLGKTGYAWMTSKDGIELYCPVPGHVGKSVFENCKNFPTIITMAKDMLKGHQGVSEYKFDRIREKRLETIKKHAVYMPIKICNTFWSIVVASSEDEVLASLVNFKNHLMIVIGVLLMGSILFSYYGMKAWGIVKEERKRKQAEDALRKNEAKYRQIVEYAPTAIFEMNVEKFRFTEVNDVMCKLLEYEEKELLTMSPLKLFLNKGKKNAIKKMKKLLSGEKISDTDEYQVITKNKLEIIVLVNVRIFYKNGKPFNALCIAQDITERKKLEDQLQRAQRIESIGTLAGGIAHDFNNILMGVQGRTSLMLYDMDLSDPNHEHIKGIEEYVRSATELTNQLLGFARRGKYDVRATDLNAIIEKASNMFGRTKKEISMHCKYQEKIWSVEVDQGQIEQVLLNLFVNSWQAMPGGGSLYIETQNFIVQDEHEKRLGINQGKFVKISVTDTGVGMDDHTMQHIFDPFFTTKEMGRGTGLGLASAYGIIKNHDGVITVYSDKDKGSTFNIYLPASTIQIPKRADISKEIFQGQNELILLVDDEDIVLNVGTQLLEKLGYRVLVAKNGTDALDIYQQKKDQIDLVILDMIMPHMGGSETFDELKEINSNIKVLLSSGYSINSQATEILNRGCNGFIQKPFNLIQLSKKVRNIIEDEQ